MLNGIVRKTLAVAALLWAAFPVPASAADLSGAGATFPYPVYAKWAESYKAKTGIGLNYQAIGSGGGIKQIKARTVTFGASDMPLKPEELEKEGLLQWPQVIGGVVPVVNIAGIKGGELILNAELIAKIYLGLIPEWDNFQIRKLNPDLRLPHEPIMPIYRADGSGTTFLFTHYLSTNFLLFKEKIGNNTAVEWPLGVGAKGNAGVATLVKRMSGSLGYVEYAYAKQNGLTTVRLQNAEGKVVSPTSEAFQEAAAHAAWDKAPGFSLILTNQPGAKSWPITGASFILMPRKSVNPESAKQALAFFSWCFEKGQKEAEALDYIPMPKAAVATIEKSWQAIDAKAAAK